MLRSQMQIKAPQTKWIESKQYCNITAFQYPNLSPIKITIRIPV